jgi:glucose-6-phosphate 1-epimerase
MINEMDDDLEDNSLTEVNIDTLNAQFSIPGQLVFKTGPGGQTVVDVSNEQAVASVILQGAHLISWIPSNQQDVIWLSKQASFSKGKSIRGGIPICWPWFGPHDSNVSFPAHGHARTVLWDVRETAIQDDGSTLIRFSITEDAASKKLWPYSCKLELRMQIGTELNIDLITENTGTDAFVISQALHTYFSVADVREISIQGLDTCDYLDKLDNYKRKKQMGAVNIDREVDRIYLQSVGDCLIDDPIFQRRIRISKNGSASTVIWNPWRETANKMGDLGEDGYLNMICVESSNAADDVVEILSGNSHVLSVNYTIESL